MSKCLALMSERARIKEPGLDFSHLDARDLMPVAILCAISIFLSLLWLICLWRYALSRQGNHESDERALRADAAGSSARIPR